MLHALCVLLDRREGQMTRRCFLLIGLVGIFVISVGCAGPTRLEMDYGTSFNLSNFNQILNPEAEKNLEPVTGLNGKAGQATMEKYQKDFEKPPPPQVYTFGIGT